jgi:hypothetical protein
MISKHTRMQSEQLLVCSEKGNKMGVGWVYIKHGNNNNNNIKNLGQEFGRMSLWLRNLKKRGHLEDLGVNER